MAQHGKPVRGLVLAGGGAKGSYQVGVYQALQELNWIPDVLTGASVGSLNGALLVMGKVEQAAELWKSLDNHGVLELPEGKTPEELCDFLLDTLRAGGLNTEPLGETIDKYLDEEAIRNSPIRYGLVMTEMNTLKSLQCPIDEIPRGKLKAYLLASSACFPALRPIEIDGVKYIDGGWRDNMPLELAARMGATELIGVDVDGVGYIRPNNTGLPTRIIRSHWDLGPQFDFDGERAARNITLGYLDTLRAFGRLGGTAYGMLPAQDSFLTDFAKEYHHQLEAAALRAPTITLTENLARQRKRYPQAFAKDPTAPTKGALAPLELAAEMMKVPCDMPYTPRLLALTFLGQFDKDPADRYKVLLGMEEGNVLGEAAMAGAVPEDFVTALVSRTLSEMKFF
ncbi:MAG: patatin-like phospholipase family protein [Gemmiger sp.]|uniref:patatin-like phospholipase family protein n=1 Tax=Gemmiger sp. TaxID=2049027 RepID=UPI002E7620ED|nr:patatin-like phospholipase family protein [Gemmiger sp.]MEE0801037.1 patatin-like phospholipase family protein [Gemmiger sp.]